MRRAPPRSGSSAASCAAGIEFAVQRQHAHARCRATALLQHRRNAADLTGTGQKHQQIAGCIRERTAHGLHDGAFRRFGSGQQRQAAPQILRLDRKAAPHRGDDRSRFTGGIGEQCSDGGTIQRRRHRDDAQIEAERRARVEHHRETQVRLQTAFMELVEQDRGHAVEAGIRLQHPRQHALGHHFDARAGSDARIEAGAIAHRFTGLFAERLRHAPRHRARGDPTRLEHQDPASLRPRFTLQRERHDCALAGTGRGLQHGRSAGQASAAASSGSAASIGSPEWNMKRVPVAVRRGIVCNAGMRILKRILVGVVAVIAALWLAMTVYAYWPQPDEIPVAKLANADDRFVTVDGLSLRYRRWATGTVQARRRNPHCC